ncbi:hypothetical protein OJF2_61680 [Aquisphaera giovannonii]|uniref:Glycosyltransferase RgtA/B/C/D-like domain-containing protein n=1 Tax=Aquisphaera giovannonii TaxID=406548 RepID=A0A5B9WAT4_9BACT|nr:hypothetical protein [Aquisphaera giovannonii]QEH37577.1 hypothetical protein OJF2_61680 [Aquisphaera giovannonii]
MRANVRRHGSAELGVGPGLRIDELHDAGGAGAGELTLESASSWLMGAPLSYLAAGLCLALVAVWLPLYLAWPWWADLDAYAVMAHSWDVGVRPYRDIAVYNFPGQIYEFWVLGRAFGWSATWSIYALDAALLVGFGGVLVWWSRRVLGRALPGWIGFVTFLTYYLGLDWTNVAQRDWRAAWSALTAMLILQASRSRAAGVLAALLFAVGFSIRPYAILFLPAALVAAAHGADGAERTRAAAVRSSLAWIVAFAAITAMLFVPLVADGLLGDFLRMLEMARSRYGGRSPSTLIRNLAGQCSFGNLAIYLGLLLAWLKADRACRPLVLACGLATVAAFAYRLVAPLDHLYLRHPLRLAIAVDVALLVGIGLRTMDLTATGRLMLTLLLAGAGSMASGPSTLWYPHCAAMGMRALRAGVPLEKAPPGVTMAYPWRDYQRALDYLRRETSASTRVANLLRERSPALCGPTARLPVFPVDTPSLDWLWLNSFHTEADFVGFLERADDSVVVWSPDEPGWHDPLERPYEALTQSVRRLYRPAARFGTIEVWTRIHEG